MTNHEYELVTEHVEITVDDEPRPSAMGAHLARPAGPGSYPGVVIGFQLFGLTSSIREVTERVAKLGYVAIAPDYHHRTAPGVELAADDAGRARGFELMDRLTRDEVLRDTGAAISYLREHAGAGPRTGMVGFSLGGHIAYLAATGLDLAATAVLYGGWLPTTDIPLSRPEPTLDLTPGIAKHGGRVLVLVGDEDRLIPAEQRRLIAERLSEAGVRHELVVYPGTPHAFFFEEAETFRPGPAEDAWRRITELLAAELTP